MHANHMDMLTCVKHEVLRLRPVYHGTTRRHTNRILCGGERANVLFLEIEHEVCASTGQGSLTSPRRDVAPAVPKTVDESVQRSRGSMNQHSHGSRLARSTKPGNKYVTGPFRLCASTGRHRRQAMLALTSR